jgi:hypothetical protein
LQKVEHWLVNVVLSKPQGWGGTGGAGVEVADVEVELDEVEVVDEEDVDVVHVSAGFQGQTPPHMHTSALHSLLSRLTFFTFVLQRIARHAQ